MIFSDNMLDMCCNIKGGIVLLYRYAKYDFPLSTFFPAKVPGSYNETYSTKYLNQCAIKDFVQLQIAFVMNL